MKAVFKGIIILFGCVALLSADAWAADVPTGDVWKPFQFLIGEWVGSGPGPSTQGNSTGEFSLSYDLDKKILVRKNRANLAAGASKGPAVHQDLMVIYPNGGAFRAEYFDNEGHVIHYGVTTSAQKLVFESDAAAAGPRFRLTYEMKSDGIVGIVFEIAPPGSNYQPYLNGTVKRKQG